MSKRDLPGLVGARICHDLISPIGAIGNGIELLTLSGGPPSPELKLISESVAGASAKVRFLRIAFGRAEAQAQIGPEEARRLLSDLAVGGKLTYDWQVTEAASRPEVRCAFLALLCIKSAMPMGGQLTISASGGVWHVYGRTETRRLQEDLWQHLSDEGNADPILPSDVHFALLPEAAVDIGRQVRWAERADGIAITF